MLEHGIALAFVDGPSSGPSRRWSSSIEQRGRSIPATVVTTPFVRPGQWARAADGRARPHWASGPVLN